MSSLNTQTRIHHYGPINLLGMWMVSANTERPKLRLMVTDDFGSLRMIDIDQMAVSAHGSH